MVCPILFTLFLNFVNGLMKDVTPSLRGCEKAQELAVGCFAGNEHLAASFTLTLRPDMTTCTIAVDPAFPENGCLKLVRGSHRLGRMDHKRVGEASGVDPERLALILAGFEIVECVMQPGDAVFFHSNTLHASGPNVSPSPRTLLHCSYNAADNEPYVADGQEHHKFRPLEKLPDNAVREGKYSTVFTNQAFRQPDPENGVNNYGYKMLKYSRRPRTAAKGKDF